MRASGAQLDEITKLIDTGVLRPIIDKTYPFDEAPQALAHVEGGRAKGKVVITGHRLIEMVPPGASEGRDLCRIVASPGMPMLSELFQCLIVGHVEPLASSRFGVRRSYDDVELKCPRWSGLACTVLGNVTEGVGLKLKKLE